MLYQLYLFGMKNHFRGNLKGLEIITFFKVAFSTLSSSAFKKARQVLCVGGDAQHPSQEINKELSETPSCYLQFGLI